MARLNYNELNDTIRYTMWSVFRIEQGVLPEERDKAAQQTQEYLDSLAERGVVVRGVYDVSGLRADADFDSKAAPRLNAQVDPRLRMRSKARAGNRVPLPHICLGRALPWHQVAGISRVPSGAMPTR